MKRGRNDGVKEQWCGGVEGRLCEFEEVANSPFLVCPHCGRTSNSPIIDTGAEWRRFSEDDVSKIRVVGKQRDRLARDFDESAGLLAVYADSDFSGGVHHAYVEVEDELGGHRKGPKTQRMTMLRIMRSAFAKLTELAKKLGLRQRILESAKDMMCDFRDAWMRIKVEQSAVTSAADSSAATATSASTNANDGNGDEDADAGGDDFKRLALGTMPHDTAAMCVILYAVCAAERQPISYAELSSRCGVSRQALNSARRAMTAIQPGLGSAHAEASGLVARHAESFAIPFSEVRIAQQIATQLEATVLEGRPANVIALGALYLVLKHQPAYALRHRNDVTDSLAQTFYINKKTARSLTARLEETPSLLAFATTIRAAAAAAADADAQDTPTTPSRKL